MGLLYEIFDEEGHKVGEKKEVNSTKYHFGIKQLY